MPYVRKSKVTFRRSRRRAARPFTRPARKKVPFAYKKSLKVAISREISRRQENKYTAYESRPTLVGAPIGPTALTGGNVFEVMPQIPQGVTMNTRIGNAVTPKWCSIAGFVSLDNTNSDNDFDRIAVRIMLVTPKRFPIHNAAVNNIQQEPQDNWLWQLLDTGVGVEPFGGTVNDFQQPINRRDVTVHGERKFILTRPRLLGTGQGTLARNGMDGVKFFKMKVPCPKVLKFTDGTQDRPNNFGPTLLVGFSLINGAIPPALGSGKQLTCSFTTRLSYEDA